MIAGVITTPDRQQYLPALLAAITPVAERVIVYNDQQHRGHWWNLSRAIREVTNLVQPGQPALVCCDDALPVEGWYDRWQAIHAEAGGRYYTMFGRKRHLFTPENLRRGWVAGCFHECWYDHGMIFVKAPTFMDDALAWFAAGGEATMPKARRTHLDMVMGHYLKATGQEYVVTTPTLFDHVGVESTLGHNIGGSYCWAGDPDRIKELSA